jgi:hypothetical protein
MDEAETLELWKKVTSEKQLRYQGNWSKRDGVKRTVMAFLKIYTDDKTGKQIPQVHFRYGERWYRFDLVDRTIRIVEPTEIVE